MEGRSVGGSEEGIREGAPGIAQFLARGSFVSVSARTGNDATGFVCDADGTGLLLDARDPSGDPIGYEFIPWSSIERLIVEG